MTDWPYFRPDTAKGSRPSKDADLSASQTQAAIMSLRYQDGNLLNVPNMVIKPEMYKLMLRARRIATHREGVRARAKRRGRRM